VGKIRARPLDKKKHPPLESVEDKKCEELWTLAGFTVISFSQPQKSLQTRGIADQLVMDNRSPTWFWFEVKRMTGPEYYARKHNQTPDQLWFQKRVETQGHRYELGSRQRVQEILIEMGRVIP